MMNYVKFYALFLLCMKYDFLLVSGVLRCIEQEREALLKFKHGLENDSGMLSSWGNADGNKECCNWYGVHCNNTTGHVTGLLLQSYFGNDVEVFLEGELSPALLELRHLNNLNLRLNDFRGHRIPRFIGSMKMLKNLDLSGCYFSGTAPQLGNLTNLRTLDLSENFLWFENLNWLSHLSLLSELNLSGSNTSSTNWIHQILELHSLKDFLCWSCPFTNVAPSTSLSLNSSTSLVSIVLSDNGLTSSMFDWLFNISTSLAWIDLSYNKLGGPIPDAFGQLNSLENLDLSNNEFGGRIPISFGNLSHLQVLRLSRNHLRGPLVLPHNKLSELETLEVYFNSLEGTVSEADFENAHNLKVLDLSFNNLTVKITPNWSPPFQLEGISLAYCEMGPYFPKWLRTQTKIDFIDLSATNISDEVPHWLWDLSPTLEYLNLSHNNIHGDIPDLSAKYHSVGELDISFNSFSGPLPIFHSNFDSILMSQNRFHGSISSICKSLSSQLRALDLSHNQFSGELPNCWTNITSLLSLNLGNNQFFGKIPQSLSSKSQLRTLILRDNNFSGELPFSLGSWQGLDTLDVGGNQLTGSIPVWIGTCQSLVVLILRENKFNGSIPHELCHLTKVQVFDISTNNIRGSIPPCFKNFTALARNTVMNDSTLPSFGFGLTFSTFLHNVIIDESIYWKRQELEYSTTLGLLKLIDLSSNDLIGDIPGELYNLEGLISLNLSRNHLSGKINPDIGQMKRLEVLDLSQNHLFGRIPASLGELHFLSVLDLSNNNFSGKIPLGTQLQGFDVSAYAGNNELCGLPLPLCTRENSTAPTTNRGKHGIVKEEDDGFILSFLKEFGLSVALGFFVGFWGVVYLSFLNSSCRTSYSNLIVRVVDWLYVIKNLLLRRL